MKKKKVTINMKKYIKPKIDIIHAAPAHLMGISKTELSSSNISVLHNSNTEGDTDISIIGGDDDNWGDIAYKGYDPWK